MTRLSSFYWLALSREKQIYRPHDCVFIAITADCGPGISLPTREAATSSKSGSGRRKSIHGTDGFSLSRVSP